MSESKHREFWIQDHGGISSSFSVYLKEPELSFVWSKENIHVIEYAAIAEMRAAFDESNLNASKVIMEMQAEIDRLKAMPRISVNAGNLEDIMEENSKLLEELREIAKLLNEIAKDCSIAVIEGMSCTNAEKVNEFKKRKWVDR